MGSLVNCVKCTHNSVCSLFRSVEAGIAPGVASHIHMLDTSGADPEFPAADIACTWANELGETIALSCQDFTSDLQ